MTDKELYKAIKLLKKRLRDGEGDASEWEHLKIAYKLLKSRGLLSKCELFSI